MRCEFIELTQPNKVYKINNKNSRTIIYLNSRNCINVLLREVVPLISNL